MPGSESYQNEHKQSKAGSPPPTWRPIYDPTPCVCAIHPKIAHIVHIMRIHVDTMPCSNNCQKYHMGRSRDHMATHPTYHSYDDMYTVYVCYNVLGCFNRCE
jgi:hypothetical protein